MSTSSGNNKSADNATRKTKEKLFNSFLRRANEAGITTEKDGFEPLEKDSITKEIKKEEEAADNEYEHVPGKKNLDGQTWVEIIWKTEEGMC
jgi:hypothetical protein